MPPRPAHLAFCAVGVTALAVSLLAGPSLAVASSRPQALRNPANTPTPQPFPLLNGYADVFELSGTDTITYPDATPIASSYTGSTADLDDCPVTFDGISNLCNDQVVFSSGFNASYFETYLSNPSGQTPLIEYGSVELTSNPPYTTNVTDYYTPYAIYVQYPLVTGQTYNDQDFTDTYQSGTYGPKGYIASTTGAQAPDGSYEYVTTVSNPSSHSKETEVTEVGSNGSASEKLTQTGYNKLTETFGAPTSHNGQEVVPVTTSGGNPLPATPAPKLTTYVPDWFPGGGAAPSPLQNEPTTYLGVQTMPSSCGSYAGSQAGEVQYTGYELDPLGGSYYVYASNYYLADGVGLVCNVSTSTETYYDNLVTGKVLYTDTSTFVQVLNSQYIPQARSQRPGWPVALPRLDYHAPPTRHLAGVLDRYARLRVGHRAALRRSPGERFADYRPM